MITTFLIDSDILINHLRRIRSLEAYLGEMQPSHSYGCSTIVIAEVYAGMKSGEESATRQLLEGLIHFPVTTKVAEKAAELKRLYRKKGTTLALDDCLIAATCLDEKAALVTLNVKHYPMLSHVINQPLPDA